MKIRKSEAVTQQVVNVAYENARVAYYESKIVNRQFAELMFRAETCIYADTDCYWATCTFNNKNIPHACMYCKEFERKAGK
jgi:hypothetical protein